MGLKDEIAQDISAIFRYSWPTTAARVVPQPSDIQLGDAARELTDAVVLYADLEGSTAMVDGMPWQFSAQVYKSFLRWAARIIRSEGGDITAYDGDRVMAIYTATGASDRAVRTAQKIYWMVRHIINPTITTLHPRTAFRVQHSVGIDRSRLHAVRTGIRGDNDIVWVGSAANHAAKLTTLGANPPTWITKAVYDALNAQLRWGLDGSPIWEARLWTERQNRPIYCSGWELSL
ncbi:adenylate/guanylate cyclase domain-containing protein [Dyella caseinilytica]|uniref:Adenylate/guanylate cyclase domain-containing protein n=1 Tax=Dyella caseinilytica TaxID=1849581 RepID=A0ABX7H124_9GAMM|nr:adenylate/guanylate cyclase domain-containing protein [Dyella caseinilytica]QRN55587.1 adenylate/guanylate cyclase domain-containing protein [Dyella caseinilytica]GGA02875.1 guanylate cyclase [Dyella caseinilytica]